MDKQLCNQEENGGGGTAKINKIQSKFDDLELLFIPVFFFISWFCSSSDLIKLYLFKFPVFVASFVCLLNLSSCILKPGIHIQTLCRLK